jgi:hypothetical protein
MSMSTSPGLRRRSWSEPGYSPAGFRFMITSTARRAPGSSILSKSSTSDDSMDRVQSLIVALAEALKVALNQHPAEERSRLVGSVAEAVLAYTGYEPAEGGPPVAELRRVVGSGHPWRVQRGA